MVSIYQKPIKAERLVLVKQKAPRSQGKHLKVAEVKDDVSISLLVSPVFQQEHSRNELREPQHLSNDGIATGDDPQDGLATEIILGQKVQHGESDWLVHT